MKDKSCCFTGHRIIPAGAVPELCHKLITTVEELIGEGICRFYSGGAVGFDMLAAEAVLFLKEKYPHITLHIIVPCENQDVKWSAENKEKYREIKAKADEVKCLSPVYFSGCMQVRNRYMVNNSSVCVAYLTKSTGGTAGTVAYAQREKLRCIVLK